MPDHLPVRWQPQRLPAPSFAPTWRSAIFRGLRARCPACGQGRLFSTWLGVKAHCDVCTAPLGLINADDAPPYFTIFIVAHVAIASQILLERTAPLPVSTELAIFVPATLGLVLALIRPVKGATVGLMMKLGFMRTPQAADDA